MININTLDENEMRFYKSAYDFYEGKLDKESGDIDKAIDNAVEETIDIFKSTVSNPNNLRKYLFEQISMIREQKQPVFMTNIDVRNSVWWDELKKKKQIEYWNRYEKYLLEKKGWPRSSIEKSINNSTDKVMNAIADPNSKLSIERKGMVVGYVQSGKTAHYIGLINKAIDAGYKIIIVLTGMHNNLRSQTQSRIDEEVLGFETSLEYLLKQMKQKPNVIGVGKNSATNTHTQTLTTRDDKGDFNGNRQQIFVSPEITTVFVVKKNYKVLEGLIEYFRQNQKHSVDNLTKRAYMNANYPLLLIDDEADQASVNTKYDYEDGTIKDHDKLSRINELIRDLFHIFDSRSYVGYTATPYANIFIPCEVETELHGKDLFPTHFILSLPKPPNYVGTHEFFGDEEEKFEMPLRRVIDVQSLSFIDQKNKNVETELPDDLKQAIASFLISTAIRICRGHCDGPNTMLIHITRLTEIQRLIHRRVEKYLENLGNKLVDGHIDTVNSLKKLWKFDYLKTTNDMLKTHKFFMEDISENTWEEVFQEICNLISNDLIKIYSINGQSKDALLYKEHKGKQYNVIAIGGDKLSRGLTLEGLTVSYFTRASKMYDTLMQMGRWFGFKPGYVDLCRLYVTDDLYAWFGHISFATEDLREQIEYMNNIEETPENFGLRVATHPNMKISSAKKVQSGEERRIAFSNVFSQTRSIDINADKYDKNFKAVDELLNLCGDPIEDYWTKLGRVKNRNKHKFWQNISGYDIVDFLSKFETSIQASKANSKYMAEYITDQLKYGGLTNWTVCLLNVGNNIDRVKFSNISVASGITRKGIRKVNNEFCSIQTLTSEDMQFYDFTQKELNQYEEIRVDFEKRGENLSNDYARKRIRNREKGLLILCPIDINKGSGSLLIDTKRKHKAPIGIAIVFPDNENIGTVRSYRINQIGLKGEDDEFFE